MALPVELFERIVGGSRIRMGDYRRDKRGSGRIGLSQRTSLFRSAVGDPMTYTVRLRDVSQAGLSIFHAVPLNVGETFVIALPRYKDTPVLARCVLMRTAVVSEDRFVSGARFAEVWDATVESAVAAPSAA